MITAARDIFAVDLDDEGGIPVARKPIELAGLFKNPTKRPALIVKHTMDDIFKTNSGDFLFVTITNRASNIREQTPRVAPMTPERRMVLRLIV